MTKITILLAIILWIKMLSGCATMDSYLKCKDKYGTHYYQLSDGYWMENGECRGKKVR